MILGECTCASDPLESSDALSLQEYRNLQLWSVSGGGWPHFSMVYVLLGRWFEEGLTPRSDNAIINDSADPIASMM